ncbi:SDR family NAD(P)-dependent oxidoreductase, partial [Rhizobium brockwellii]|uniref:SDR family NAD(P)-dependent oxidoreductase n=1 Tax=Rhizobium brockwellii TaxID=3019932 RepID=UPI003F9C0F61
LDFGDADSFPAFVAEVNRLLSTYWGRDAFDCIVNNAGFGMFNLMETVTTGQFDALMIVHLKGPFFLTQALLPLMVDGGV